MATTRVIKIKNQKTGVVYLYEDRPYWDKDKKCPTHERKCIGKIAPDGTEEYNEYYRNREKMQALEVKAKEPARVSKTTLVGQTLILDVEAKRTKVGKVLAKTFGDINAARIMALAYYVVCRGKALSRSEQWLEDRGYGNLGITSQRISDLLAKIDRDSVNTFLKGWLEANKPSDTLLFDITSVSTYGKNNPYSEYGYNRDREKLEQINLALLTSCSTGLPLWVKELEGSMADVAIVNDTIDELRKLGISSFTFCGDRGFYSAGNLQNLSDKGIGFLIPVPSSVKWGREMIAEHRSSLVNPMNVIYDGEGVTLYGKTVYKTTKEYGRTWYHIFYDPVRKDKLVASFMVKLKACYDELVSGKEIEGHRSLYEQYFIVKETPKRGRKVMQNDDAVKEYLENDSCYWILIGTSKRSAPQALQAYRNRGEVELNFDDLKNVCDLNRLRCHSSATITGKIFINFVALILLSSLKRTVSKIEEKDRHYWSASDMLDKVETYSKVHFIGKYKDAYSTPTLKQRQVFDLLGIKYIYKGEEQNCEPQAPQDL